MCLNDSFIFRHWYVIRPTMITQMRIVQMFFYNEEKCINWTSLHIEVCFLNLQAWVINSHLLTLGLVYFNFSVNESTWIEFCEWKNNSLHKVWLKVCYPKSQTCWSLQRHTRPSWQLALLSTETNMVTTLALNACIGSCSLLFRSSIFWSRDAARLDRTFCHWLNGYLLPMVVNFKLPKSPSFFALAAELQWIACISHVDVWTKIPSLTCKIKTCFAAVLQYFRTNILSSTKNATDWIAQKLCHSNLIFYKCLQSDAFRFSFQFSLTLCKFSDQWCSFNVINFIVSVVRSLLILGGQEQTL